MVLERLRQFRNAGVRPTRDDYAFAREWLVDDRLFELFAQQEPRDIVHAVRTAQWLQSRGHTERDLMLAALLHDIGKGEQRTRDRVAWVVAQALRLEDVAAADRSKVAMRRALARSADHAAVGAVLLREAGAPAAVVEYTLLHHDPVVEDGMLALLQAADAAC